MTVDRRTIVEAALGLLDDEGLDRLTVRRLAERLGVKSPALYWHFRDKRELLDRMAEHLRPPQSPPGPGEDWRSWSLRRARERRAALLSHRDAARVVAGSRAGAATLAAFDAELAVLVGFGFGPVRAVRAAVLVDHYVVGSVLQQQADAQRHADAGETPPEDLPEEARAALTGATPTLAAALAGGGDPGGDEAFEDGLLMIVDGIAAGLERDRTA
ncbi:TetR/AcrR family transcriptional regulator C-terminal domain-containing protein [Nocardiopsis sp. NPDC006198]|uniref:TetR/AcrR family transcriptional regulator C-terminal domain-containing protein n=1 Tax=Nocardiopsis sp. NPDC006198 TaxID=3154472 RepID=UPI0033B62CA8